mgnify:FL=1
MAKKLYEEASVQDIAAAIREKTGGAETYKIAQMGDAVRGLTIGDQISHADIPRYVKAEALAVAEKVKAVLKDDSIVFFSIADFHHAGPQVDNWQTNINAGNLHACQALKVLSYSLPQIDFACMLGDVTFGNAKTTTAMMQQQFDEINGWLAEAWSGIPQLRTVGNHDTGEYSTLVGAQFLRDNITKYNEGAVYGSEEYGYCYRDFPDKKLRVICLNTCEGETVSGNNAAYCCSPEQLLWFAQTLHAVGSKIDAAQWGIIVLGHYPLDLGGAYPTGNIAKAYVAGESTVQNGVTVNFSGHNAAKFIMNVHGHNHCFQYGKLHSVENGKGTEFDAWRMCTPNACFYRNNSGVVTMYGISFGDPAPYDKTAGSGKDTAFNVNVINPSEQVFYSFCYGAGIDRTIGYAATVYHSITNALTNVTTSNDTVAAEDGTSYTATLTAKSGYTLGEVTVKMGGANITATAYNADTGVISIAAVTGDVVITAKATKEVSYHNLVPTAVDSSGASAPYTDGKMLSSSGVISDNPSFVTTGFIPFDGGASHTYRIGGDGIKWNEYGSRIAWYKADFSLKGSVLKYDQLGKSIYFPTKIDDPNAAVAFTTDINVAPPQGAAYFRVSAKGKGGNLIITLDEPIE